MKAIKLLGKIVNDGCRNDASCPAIMEADNGDFLVIGKKPADAVDLNKFAGIAEDEFLVVIPRELLLGVKDKI